MISAISQLSVLKSDAEDSEAAIIARARRGDEAAVRALYDDHVRPVHRLAYRLTASAADAEDITQDTFIRALERLAQFRGEVPFGAWLRSVTISVALNFIRQRSRRSLEVAGLEIADARGVPDQTDLRLRLEAAIKLLPEHERIVLILHDCEGYTHNEIARMVGIPAGTSRAKLSYARSKLREILTRHP